MLLAFILPLPRLPEDKSFISSWIVCKEKQGQAAVGQQGREAGVLADTVSSWGLPSLWPPGVDENC